MNTPYVETNCTIEHEGYTFEAGGAYVTDTHAVAYLPSECPMQTYGQRYDLTDWHGNKIGTFTVKSARRNPRHYWQSTHTYYIAARINGIDYYGQTQGPGMIATLKAYKHQ